MAGNLLLAALRGLPNLPDLILDCHRARQGDVAAWERLGKAAISAARPDLVPALGIYDLAKERLGLAVTPTGIDASRLNAALRGEQPVPAAAEPSSTAAERCAQKLKALRSGAIMICGYMGKGKTTLAHRLAQQWHEAHGYEVLAVTAAREDLRPWMRPAPIERFVDDMHRLTQALAREDHQPVGLQRKVIIIDDAVMTLSTRGSRERVKTAVAQAIIQSRHIDWIVVIVAHVTKLIPTQLSWCDVIFCKEPTGDEQRIDREEMKEIWQAAEAAYAEQKRQGLGGHPLKAWVYAHAPNLGYRGMMLHGLPTNGAPLAIEGP